MTFETGSSTNELVHKCPAFFMKVGPLDLDLLTCHCREIIGSIVGICNADGFELIVSPVSSKSSRLFLVDLSSAKSVERIKEIIEKIENGHPCVTHTKPSLDGNFIILDPVNGCYFNQSDQQRISS
jgi:hypothetical protein